MNKLQAISLAFLAVNLSACDKLFESKDKGLAEIKQVEQRWIDGVELAGSTARIALSTQVANLQSIKRDLDTLEVSECLEDAKAILNGHMELTINGFLQFMGNHEFAAREALEQAGKKLEDYRVSRDTCAS